MLPSSTCCNPAPTWARCWTQRSTPARKRRWRPGCRCSFQSSPYPPMSALKSSAWRWGSCSSGTCCLPPNQAAQGQGDQPAGAATADAGAAAGVSARAHPAGARCPAGTVAWALAPGGQVPLVTLRLQVWMRALRRMVGKVTSDPARVELRADKDLKARPDGFYLPLIQCSECHTTGWLSRLAPASRKLSNRLDEIYNTWFSGRSEAVRLYAGEDWRRPY